MMDDTGVEGVEEGAIGHIGIVAVSAPGAALCYETISVEAGAELGQHRHPEMTLHALDFAAHVDCIRRDDWNGVAALLLASAEKVAAAGADFAICPDNTAHLAMERVVAAAPLPWLHIADAVAAEAVRLGYRRVGLLGTRPLVESAVYPERLRAAGIEWRVPDSADRAWVDHLIFEDLVVGRITDRARSGLARIIEVLRSRDGCDAVVLGCTEIPLVVSDATSSLPVLDSTRVLARAALRRAAGGFGGEGG